MKENDNILSLNKALEEENMLDSMGKGYEDMSSINLELAEMYLYVEEYDISGVPSINTSEDICL